MKQEYKNLYIIRAVMAVIIILFLLFLAFVSLMSILINGPQQHNIMAMVLCLLCVGTSWKTIKNLLCKRFENI